MSLLDQLKGGDESIRKIPVHQFYSALKEWQSGELTRDDIVAFFELDAQAQSDLDWLKTKLDSSANKDNFIERIHNIFMLAEYGMPKYQLQSDLVGIINRIG